ncbi:hypothetical protein GS429_07885 [Natronorubrum sp. JWXQ-INN-674]|uniref:Uncharacterized protein n=1 Tax=Natronorubrum halalkaliphilum TaxID=2691917 RepID=A0A6B0VKC0_9EURY|nr:hypothetical protein [Natronorubrum halalkaliphilum]MXV61978.1 hypothetical protein [Natronorubrum halalkaliphilum]
MPTDDSRPIDRRRVIQVLGAGGALALAGCLGDDEDTADETNGAEDDTSGDEDEMNGDKDDTTGAEESELASLEPTPEGDSLSEDDIQALVAAFDDEPMNDAQQEANSYTPRHVWKWVSDENFIGLHFNEPNPEEATELDYITIGQKGLFTEESQPSEEFTHFHQHTADGWEDGHGGETGDEGYWLTHIAVREIEYPFHDEPIEPQVDYGFMPTPPEEGSEGHETDWETPDGGEGDLSAEDRDVLIEAFDDSWTEGQDDAPHGTPAHVWKWVSEETFLFLHFDDPAVEEAENLIYFGMGKRGQFTSDDIPAGQADEFTHFHKHEADSWDAGHGGQDAEQWGAWLVHHATRDHEMPWGDVEVGVDREFMPTEAPE